MRKLVVLAGLLLAAALLPGTSAQAAPGCLCARIDQAPICVADVGVCAGKVHGVCVGICDYSAPKKMKHHAKKHHAMKKAAKPMAKKPAAKKAEKKKM